jgi:hypothetical protein
MKKNTKIKKWLFSIAILLAFTTVKAQIIDSTDSRYIKPNPDFVMGCGTMDIARIGLAVDSIKAAMIAYENSMVYKQGGALPVQSQSNYVIPVVFHYISSNVYGITYAQMEWQINALNAAFANSYSTYNGNSTGTNAVNTNISFCLAKNFEGVTGWTNPSEPGLMRYPQGATFNAPNTVAGMNAVKAVVHPTGAEFPSIHYLNIYLVDNINTGGGGTTIGYGTFPNMGMPIDGIVFRQDCIGDNSLPNNFYMFGGTIGLQQGKILAHEVGHFLGLYHTFEICTGGQLPSPYPATPVWACYGINITNCASDGDLICDTPPTTVNGNSCGATPNTCVDALPAYANADQVDQLENFMCYSSDLCLNTFTGLQAGRMYSAIDNAFVIAPATAPRVVLVSPANLIATGVMGTHGCAQQLLTAVFNSSATSGCVGTVFTFTTPTGSALSANSWSWTFGDGGTSTVTNPSHTYTAAGIYTVTLVANDGVNPPVSNSTVIQIGFLATLSAQSTTTVCTGSTQSLLINFIGTPPFTATVSNGVNTYTVGTNLFSAIIPVTLTANTTYSLTAATNSGGCSVTLTGTATYSVVNCCSNIVQNGDFSAGNTLFTSANLNYCTGQAPGLYCVGTFSPSTNGWSSVNLPMHGNCLFIDGIDNSSSYGGPILPAGATSSNVWAQNVTLTPNTDYEFSFSVTGNNPPNYIAWGEIILFEADITDLTSAAVYNISGNIRPATVASTAIYPQNWETFTFNWHSPALLSNNCKVNINQITNFSGGGYDYLIDDIYLKAQGKLTVNAGSPITICNGGSGFLNATATGTTSTSSYTWTPSTGLSNPNILNPIAAPTTTTIYTLSGSDMNLCASTATTTVTVITTTTTPLVISPTSTNICSGGTATLTASGAATYTWSTSAHTNTISVSPSTTSVYTVTSTSSSGCASAATATVNITPNIAVTGNMSICLGSTTTLTASGATTYSWSTGATNNSITVSPTLTTSYTLTGTAACTNSIVVTVSVSTTPTITISGLNSICTGASSTLTASGATYYSWSTGSTSNPIIVSPTSSTYYTVTGHTGGCVSTKTITIGVTASPTLTGIGNVAICTGGTVTITAGGATTYSWSTGATTSTVSVHPTSTTVYTVTGTTGVCPTVGTVTVTVNPIPTLTATASPATICAGGTSVLGVFGATNYTWSPGGTLSCLSCSNPNATPSSNTTYSVIGNANGCISPTATVAVSIVSACTGTLMPSYTVTANGSFTSNPGLLNNNLYINSPASYTISTAELRISPNYSITVRSGATLVISGSWLHACTCPGQLWQGIYVENGGTLIINNYSIIEDAVNAVKTASGTTASIPTWKISSTIFNKNSTGIYVGAQLASLAGSYIYNTVFTCRSIGNHTITSANFSNIKANIAAATPGTPSTANPTANTLGGARSQFHIYLNRGANTAGINIGDKAQSNNLFDYADNGIYSAATAITVKNNTFQNFTGNSNATNTMTIGVAINVITIDGQPLPKVVIGNSSTTVIAAEKNYFTNCLRGVMTNGCEKVYINNNTFYNESTANNFLVAGTHVIGEFGVIQTKFGFSSSTTILEGLQYANNTCQNYATAYSLDFRKVYNTASQSMYFLNNVINGAGTSTKYTNYGIYLAQSTTYGANTTTVPQDMISITTNSITNINTSCISVNTVNTSTVSGFVTINANTELSLLYQNYSALQSPRVAAIGLYNSTYTKVSDNSIIKCTGLSTYPSTNSQNLAGIYTTNCPLSTVNCNSVTCVGEGFVFEGASPNSTWRSNQTNTGQYGLVLRTNGYMGNQGAPSNSIRTLYGNYSTVNLVKGQTFCDNSNPDPTGVTPAALYVSNLGLACPNTTFYNELPCNNGTNTTHLYSTGSTPPTLIITGNTGTSPCVTSGGGGTGGSGMVANSSSTNTSDQSSAPTSSNLQSLVAPGTNLQMYNTEARWANQYYVNSIDATIAAASGYGNAKTFALADAAFEAGKYTQAQNLVNSISPINIIETNWKNVDNILLKQVTLPAYTLTSGDITTLNNVAQQCPITGGTIVYKARAILNSFYSNIIEYHYDCQPITISGNRVASNADNVEGITLENQTVSLYPNPNNGTMMLDYSIKGDANLEICDLSGRLVGTYFLPATGTHAEVKNNELYNGIYIYRVTSNGVVIKIGKIIVMQ